MIKLYIIGLSVLIVAIIANVVVGKLGISTWYDFGPNLYQKGFIAIKEVGLLNSLWLFLLYPLCLGLGYLLGLSIFNFFS
mgnify:FL=1